MIVKYFDIPGNGLSVRCKLYCSDPLNIRELIVACHGFGGNKENAATQHLAERVLPVRKAAAILIFDWPCHGADVRQRLSLDDCGAYLDAVLYGVRRRFDPERLYGFATSFGGYLMLRGIHARGNPFRRAVLRCPAVNMYETFRANILTPEDRERLQHGKELLCGFERKLRVAPAFLEALRAQDITRLDYSALSGTLLILHGTRDELVPIDAVRAFAQRNRLDFIEIEGADHLFRDPARLSEALDYTQAFLFDGA